MWCRPSLSSRSRHNVLSQPSGNTSKLIRPPKSRRQHQSCILTSPHNHQSCFFFFCSFLNAYGNTKQWAKIFPKQRDNWTNERKSFLFIYFFYEDKRAKTTPLTPRHTVKCTLRRHSAFAVFSFVEQMSRLPSTQQLWTDGGYYSISEQTCFCSHGSVSLQADEQTLLQPSRRVVQTQPQCFRTSLVNEATQILPSNRNTFPPLARSLSQVTKGTSWASGQSESCFPHTPHTTSSPQT